MPKANVRALHARSSRNTGTWGLRSGRGARPAALAAATALIATTSVLALPATTAWADGGQCTFPSKNVRGPPLGAATRHPGRAVGRCPRGKSVRVAVIDTGVDVRNPQLTKAVDAARRRATSRTKNLKDEDGDKIERGNEPTAPPTRWATARKVAGIIAARPLKGTGFVGLAPDAEIIPIQQNDAEGHGTAHTLATAIRHAVQARAPTSSTSPRTRPTPSSPTSGLEEAVDDALDQDVVVVASAGNDGLGGNVKETYPASYEGVLAVAASDRNNERASFSQSGDFVGVAAPGVDMISTVPGGGHCSDNGTSFSAPYVAGVAALIKAKHPKWTAAADRRPDRADRGTLDRRPRPPRRLGSGRPRPRPDRWTTEPRSRVPKPEDGLAKGRGPCGHPAAVRRDRRGTQHPPGDVRGRGRRCSWRAWAARRWRSGTDGAGSGGRDGWAATPGRADRTDRTDRAVPDPVHRTSGHGLRQGGPGTRLALPPQLRLSPWPSPPWS